MTLKTYVGLKCLHNSTCFYLTDLPKLVEQPKITNNKCGNLTLSWIGWVEDVDIGKGPIAQYL